MTAKNVLDHLHSIANPEIATHSQRFFKTGPGQYGEGDVFLGIRVPEQRKTARLFKDLSLDEAETLLQSRFHEARLTALFILVGQFKPRNQQKRSAIFDLYVRNAEYVNNWDLVDSSAPAILGGFLADENNDLLFEWANDDLLWKRRMAMLATLDYIRKNRFETTFRLAEILLHDSEDLIHKAVGWLLREVGKKDRMAEEAFLVQHYQTMPRTMLRYAIEHFEPERRKQYLTGTA